MKQMIRMKRWISIVMTAVLILASIPLNSGNVQAAVTLPYFENFETWTSGNVLSSLGTAGTGTATTSSNVTVKDIKFATTILENLINTTAVSDLNAKVVDLNGSKVLHLIDNVSASKGSISALTTFTPQTVASGAKFNMEYDFLTNTLSGGTNTNARFRVANSSNNIRPISIETGSGNKLQYRNASNALTDFSPPLNFSTGKWYHIKFELDLLDSKYNVIVTDSSNTYTASSVSFITSPTFTDIGGLEINTGDGAQMEFYLDNIKVYTALPAPTLSAPTVASGKVDLSWSSVTGATYYNVKRSNTSGSLYTSINTSPVTGLSYSDTTVTNGQDYYYVITAVSPVTESVYSNQVKASPIAPSAQPAPSGLTAIGGNNKVDLQWTAATGAASYNVKRKLTSESSYTILQNVAALSFTDNSALNGTAYDYVVTAVNVSSVESANSNSVSATPNTPSLPAAPANLVVWAGDKQASLYWGSVSGAASYKIKRSAKAGGPYTVINTVNAGNASFTDTGLTNGTTYYYVVTAVNALGESDSSSEVSGKTRAFLINDNFETSVLGDTPSGYVTIAAAADAAINNITVINNNNLTNKYYLPTEAAPANNKSPAIIGNSTNVLWINDNANASRRGGYTNTFTPVSGKNGLTAELDFMQPKVIGDSYPLELLDSSGKTVLSFSVTNLNTFLPINPSNAVNWYNLKFVADTGTNSADVFLNGIYEGNYKFSTLDTNISKIQARTAGSSTGSMYVDNVRVYKQSAVTPQMLTTAGANNMVVLKWGAASGADSYNVYRSTTSKGAYTRVATDLSSPTYTDTGLENKKNYYYVVTSVNASGESDFSHEALGYPNNVQPPASAPVFSNTAIRDSQITLNWSEVQGIDGDGMKVVSTYTLYRSTTPNGPFVTVAQKFGGLTYLDKGLVDGTEYYYQVVAENMGGSSPSSDLLKVAPAAPVGAPTLLSAVPGNGSVTLNWSPVAKATGYSVKRSTASGGPYTEFKAAGTSYTDNSAANGTIYYYVITAFNASQVTEINPEKIAMQESRISNQLKVMPYIPVSGAPVQPINLQAAVDTGSVKLTWSEVPGATQYKVKRATTSGGSYDPVVSSSAASYEDKSVVNGTTYYYVVSAVNASGESQQSDEVVVLPAKVLTVDASPTADQGTFKTIQSAVNSIPTTNTERTVIYIKPGTYTEKLVVTRPYVSLVGAGMDVTKIVYGDYAGTAATTGQPGHTGNTFLSQTVDVNADYFMAANLTIENSAGPRSAVAQAVALSLKSDMATFESVKLIGYQDTLYTGLNAAGKGRHYFHNSIIQGDVDFIFGEAPAVVFDNVKMVLVSQTGGGGHITAAAQKNTTDVGYVFLNSQVVDDASAQGVYDLGRPWKDNASVSFINTLIDSKKFLNAGWIAACAGTCLSYSFNEYNSYGAGADAASRQIAKQLTGSEASKTISTLFSGWDPSIPVMMPKVSYLPTVSVTNSTFDKKIANQADIQVMLQANGIALNKIKNNQTVLGKSDYSVSGSVVTLNKSFLAGLQTGATTLVFEFGESFVPLTIHVVDTSATDIGKQILAVNDGWASFTTGTKGGAAAEPANIYTVTKRSELIKALGGNNGTNATNATPKIIYIKGTIDMNVDDNDNPVGMEYYKDAAYDLNAYLAAYDPAVWGRTSVPSGPLETARAASETNQGNKIKINVGPNTTIVGLPGSNAKVLGGNLMIQNVDNVIIRNIDFQNAFDYFPQWDPTDGDTGNWNSAFDNITIKNGTHIWIDHNTFSDGSQPDDHNHTYFGRKYQLHDGTLDITNTSDLITVSYNYFHDHDKTTLVGGSDSFTGDTGKERITFHHNYYQNVGQRAPRVRYGQVHLYNNFYEGSYSHPTYPYLYSMGVGVESQIYAQNNYFVQDAGTPAQALIQVLGGKNFTDKGSVLNGAEVNIAASSGGLSDVSWTPTLFTSMDATKEVPGKVTAQAGAENTLPVMSAPTLTATPFLRQVNLSWNAVTGAKTYSVKRSLTSGGPYELVADKLTSTSYVDTGLIRSMTYYYVVTAVKAAGVEVTSNEANARVTYEDSNKSSGNSSSTPSGSSGGTVTAPANDSSIRVTPLSEKRADGTTVARVIVDAAALSKALDSLLAAGSSTAEPKIRIEAEVKETAATVEIPASSISDVQGKVPAAVLSIKLDNVTYSLPVKLIDVKELAKGLGADVKDVKVIISIEKVTGASAAGLESKAKENGLKLLNHGVDFKITVEANGKSTSINDFGSTYVERTLEIPNMVDPNKVTAVLYNPATGKLIFVPAIMKVNGGVTGVTIKRPGNSIYAIVESGKTFADLNGHWAKSDIDLLASKLVVDGTTATSFAPQSPITRAEFATLLTRALGLNEGNSTAYSDVSANDWYAGSVSAASKAGLVAGFEDGSFRPSANITREQMAVMVSRAIGLAGKKVDSDAKALAVFTDSKAINSWASSAVAQSVNAGIINGKSADAFMPNEHASRAEAAVMLKRLLQFVEFMN